MPIPSLPAEIKELMNTLVTWEKFVAFDGHAEPSYSPAIELKCWIEPHDVGAMGGVEVFRTRDGVIVEPQYDMYFSGDDPRVRGISVYDRFTVPSVDATDKPLQALRVSTMVGPPFDAVNPWLVLVSL